MVIKDEQLIKSKMNGKLYDASIFAHELRSALF